MKDYIKPTFILAAVTTTAMTSNTCSMKNSEFMEMVGDAGLNWDFSSLESCTTFGDEVEMVCKFTAGEIGAITVLGS